ncbi:MAG: glycosyltransferase [Ardenticatenales bacterium]|nr:glycosyltransferase [Ardenticatenales bacterium]
MRIALLTEKFPPEVGGLAVSVQRLAQGLVRVGHEIEVFVLSEALRPGQAEDTTPGGLLVHRLGAHRRSEEALGAWFQQVVARHTEQPFDLLHGYFLPRAGFIAAYVGTYLRLPSVVSARGNDLDRALFDPARAAHILYALQSASAITGMVGNVPARAVARAAAQIN